MTIDERLNADVKDAMRAREPDRVACIRMLRSKLQEKTVALRAKEGKDYELTDEQALEAIAAYGKQRRDSIAAYKEAGRDDLAAKEEAELKIVAAYLPQQMTEDEIRPIVEQAVKDSGATSPKEMGAVMKILMPQVKGKADGKLVNEIVKETLAAAAAAGG